MKTAILDGSAGAHAFQAHRVIKLLAGAALFVPLISSAETTDTLATISTRIDQETLSVSASARRFAGAIVSIKYRGVEYIDLADHGRQLQSALQVDNLGECFNPTEAGSRADGTAMTSSSVLNRLSVEKNVMTSKTRAAFWLSPREDYRQVCSPYTKHRMSQHSTVLSDYTIERKTSFHGSAIPNVVNVETRFLIPEDRNSASVEALTGYLTPKFRTFLAYNRTTRVLTRLAPSPAGQYLQDQLIVAHDDGAHAMGMLARQALDGPPRPSAFVYFYFNGKFPTAKWSCWFGEDKLKAGTTLSYACPIAVGSVDEVIAAMDAFPAPGEKPVETIPVFRFYKSPRHMISRSFKQEAAQGYRFEGTGFHLFPAKADGLRPLFQCHNPKSKTYSVSLEQSCGGQSNAGTLGYVAAEARANLVPLYRFDRPKQRDVLITTNRAEGARYPKQTRLGYVQP